METEIIQRFLESVGQKADVDLYLRLFRAERKDSFAILAANAQIVNTALDPVHFDLRILAGLGLLPAVMLGLFEPKDADRQAERVREWLLEDGVPARLVGAGPGAAGSGDLGPAVDDVRAAIAAGEIPLVSLEAAKDTTTEARFRLLASLAETLETRKVVFLSRRAGLGPQGGPPLSVVNLAADYDRLMVNGALTRGQASLLRQAKVLLERVHHRMSVAVVNPLQLLRELFTISGAGTLIRRGSRIEVHAGWNGADLDRLRTLFESAFGRPLSATFFDDPVDRVYREEGYSGAAVMRQTPVGAYLSKFAVERPAQGEGLGTELWSLITRDFPAFFWRARPTNPITPWYVKQCDGLCRFPEWHVFWRGIEVRDIDPAVRFALAAPQDFG
jgi:bifunctional N-acetylglutamate synthase/kinase